MKIIYAPVPKITILDEAIWVNLITGYDVQIIDMIISNNISAETEVLYAPSVNVREDIISSVRGVFRENKNFYFKYYEKLSDEDYKNSDTLLTDGVRNGKNYFLVSRKKPILYLSYLFNIKGRTIKDMFLINNISEIKSNIKRFCYD